MYAINPNFRCQVRLVGIEKTPVIILDQVLTSLEPAINYAVSQAKFKSEQQTYYPGMRATIDQAYQDLIVPFIHSIITEYFTVPQPHKIALDAGYYSLICRAESMLKPEQCIPHFDSKTANYFAITHYLNPGDFSGTAFYRHRQTQTETVTEQNVKLYFDSLNQYVANQGMLQQKYFSKSDEIFELIELVPYQANRMLIYPGALLHSAFVDDVSKNVIIDPKKGRLTANLFIELTN
ncbi:DUF6445 family protein [Catenovulum adriaticum]|uniref:DUF6445 family protein n=1 Tax=Catenovulum adriaticum TaxID=2984846 RepID=A0ABY7ATV2_9ALTE|nr:DUF6445 family protein [Catenovulum sp. TS8]WAJ72076.1 DUF6445 family protein [Catenovulum sp. TS8]